MSLTGTRLETLHGGLWRALTTSEPYPHGIIKPAQRATPRSHSSARAIRATVAGSTGRAIADTHADPGDVPNVVFPCAALVDRERDRLTVYYGGADTVGCPRTGISPRCSRSSRQR